MATGEKTGRAISRRDFARRAALASGAAALVPMNVLEASAPPSTVQPSTEQSQQPTNLPKLTPEGQAEVDARFQSILAQYGSRFSEEQKADIRRLCTVAQPPLDRLRAYNLQNGDPPALYLKPLVEREKKRTAAPRSSSPGATTTKPGATPPAAKTPDAGKPTAPPSAKTPGETKKP